ncbi:MAG: prolipoprotein diacylglyceryl transferase [Crocinitomicaceae bacterium]|nr:prolipoprotein diacylglyceryl transferase [Crocinitomicaceae bacterium]
MRLAINWDVSSELIEGYNTPNLYGLLFVTGLIIGYLVVKRIYKREQIDEDKLDKLVLYMILATIIGARLGHVLFYGPYFDEISAEGIVLERGYFSHPLDILKVWEGGLASHGGILAIIIALYFYSKKVVKKPMLWILDRIAAPGAIAGAFIRAGNLVNHEIVGDVTDVPWGFRFLHNDCYPPYDCSWESIPIRHPAQLYEAICYLVIFAIIMYMFWKKNAWKKPGLIFGTFMVLLFSARFLVEFVKLGQAARDATSVINTGQMLSIPFILVGLFFLWKSLSKKEKI